MWQQVQDNGKVRFFERFTDARTDTERILKSQSGYTSTKQRNFKRRATRKCVPSGFCKFATQKLRDT